MNKYRYVILIMMAIASFTANSQPGKDSDSKAEATARELLEMSGGGKLGDRVIEQIVKSFQEKLPDVPASFWDEIRKEIHTNDLVTLAAPAYVKHFTVNEMRDIMKFYKTPAGAKLVQSMPEITQEMSRVGKEWGKGVSEQVVHRLQEQGYLRSSDQK